MNAGGSHVVKATAGAQTMQWSLSYGARWNQAAVVVEPVAGTGAAYTYDTNGNLLSDSTWNYTWDYKNRLGQATNGTATSTYAYDHQGQRVKLDTGTAATLYPNKYYNTSSTSTTKHIFTPSGTLIATVTNDGSGGPSGITVDSTAQTSHTGEPATVNWDHTVGDGENGLAMACVSGLSEPNAPTWGGQAMTLITSESPTKCYYLLNPTTSTTTQVSVSGGNIKVGGSMVFFGVDQTDPIGAITTENGSTSPNGMTLTTEADNSIRVDVLGANRDDSTAPTASLDSGTVQFNDVVPQNQFRIGLFGYATEQATAGQATHTWTTSASTRKYLAFEVKAATSGTASSTTHYLHTDHLGGTHVVSDDTGQQVELNDYYPFGELRLDEGSVNEQRKFTGHEYDGDTDLLYMGARYQNPGIGKFISQDPISQQSPEKFLQDPQLFNMYSYARNNPVLLKDPDGRCPICLVVAGGVLLGSLFNDINAAQAPATVSAVDANVQAVSFAELTVPGYENLPAGEQLGIEFALGALFTKNPSNLLKIKGLNLDKKSFNKLQETLGRIRHGDPSVFKRDGSIFYNKEGKLPDGNYSEYTVETPGMEGRGTRRVIQNTDTGQQYYTDDHYESFTEITE